jgi:rhodanese-related sulfurtransferase
MKNISKLYLMVLLIALVACSQSGAQTSELLAPAEFEKKLSTVKDKQVIDVRTPDEFLQGHLADAVMIDFYKDDFKSRIAKLDRAKPVFVYCAAGGRSGSATEILEELGFKKIYDLKGGYRAWTGAGKPVTK